jgi:hypothetical protein
MIDALRKELSKRKRRRASAMAGGGGGGAGGGGRGPLVPPAAELKMLRTLQLQINSRTVVLAKQKEAGRLPQDKVADQHRRLAERQKRMQTMTEAIAKRLRLPPAGQ